MFVWAYVYVVILKVTNFRLSSTKSYENKDIFKKLVPCFIFRKHIQNKPIQARKEYNSCD